MIRPIAPTDYRDRPAWAAYDAAVSAWEASPEGMAEIAEYKARRQAAYDAAVPVAIEALLREREHGLPARAIDRVLAGNLVETPALTEVRGANDLLVLAGSAGTGKTIAAVAWIHAHVAAPALWHDIGERDRNPCVRFKGHVPTWISASQLARVSHYDQAAVDRIAKAPRLVVDDLFSEYVDAKGFFSSLLDEIIDARYSGLRPTIITTNLDAAGFVARYGQRIADRVRESGRFFNCGNVSLRRRTAT